MEHQVRLIHVSDTHLSGTHAYFEDNWRAVQEAILAEKPDFIVHGGDLTFNGPANFGDLDFGGGQMATLGAPWRAVAGNHDIGEAPPFSRLAQPINAERMAAWRAHIGPLWWVEDLGGWRLIGLDTALMGSGLPEEVEQTAFFAEALAARAGRPVMVFIHMPPFVDDPDDESFTTSAIPFPARAAFLNACVSGGVKVIACGHLHVYRRIRHRGLDIVWAPATAMVDSQKRRGRAGPPRPGYLVWELSGMRATHRLVEPERAFIIDMKGWTRRNGGTTTTLPPLPRRHPAEV